VVDKNDPYEDALQRGHNPDYVHALKRHIDNTSPEVLVICRAWHGEKFGWPGHGGEAFVAVEIARAEVAVKAIARLAADAD